jgi:Na+(H+)/acetate symporter ActP
MTTVDAINAGDITKIGIGIIVVLVVVGALLSIVITAILARVLIVVVVVVLAIFVWQQRTHVENRVNKNACQLNARFFGIHLDAPNDVVHYCRTHGGTS